MKISIIVPIYNEEEKIQCVLADIKEHMSRSDYEIIVVDDGSTDHSVEIIEQCKNVRLIRKHSNNGYGAALKTGIKHAQFDSVLIIDADGTYPAHEIPALVERYKQGDADMVVGARVGKNVHIPLLRRPAKWFLNKLANYLAAAKIPDLNSGLRIIKKAAVEEFIHILPDGFSFTTTITLALLTNGYTVKFLPISYYKREGHSKIKPLKDTLNFLQLIIRTILYFNPLRIFLPLSLLLFISAFLILLLSWFFLPQPLDVTFGVVLMTSLIILSIGMLADLIDKRMR